MKTTSRARYRTLGGRTFDLATLKKPERNFLIRVHARYQKKPEWSTFGAWWIKEFDDAGLADTSAVYRICQDLEARVGVEQGMVAPPDYREYLIDLIEEKYGTRYKFCKDVGIDPGQLSRVLRRNSDFSIETLTAILEKLDAVLVVQMRSDTQAASGTDPVFEALGSLVA